MSEWHNITNRIIAAEDKARSIRSTVAGSGMDTVHADVVEWLADATAQGLQAMREALYYLRQGETDGQ